MKVLVFGGSSVIGSRLVSIFDNADYTYFRNNIKIEGAKGFMIDIRNEKSVIDLIKKLNPDLVIHAAAAPNMDICEIDKKMAYDIHINGAKNIVEGCKAVNAKVVFLSTSAVFDGKKKIYTEEDETCAISYYGITKAEAEKVIIDSSIGFIIIRIDHPYGWVYFDGQKKNTAVRVLENLEKGMAVEEIIDWYNNPTFVDNLCIVIKKLVGENAHGIYHAVGPDFLSRHDFAMKIAEVFEKDKNLVKKKVSDKLNLPAKRTNCNLDSKKTEKKTGIKLLGIKEGLEIMKKQRIERIKKF